LRDHFPHQFEDLQPRGVEGATTPWSDGVVLADLAAHDTIPPGEIASDRETMENRVERARAHGVAVTAKLVDQTEAVHGLLRGMVQDVDLDEAEEEVSYHGGACRYRNSITTREQRGNGDVRPAERDGPFRDRSKGEGCLMGTVSVRYFVDDVDTAIRFYTERLGFELAMRPGPGFAVVSRGDLRLLLSGIGGPGGAAQAMPDGRRPEPGGWNRIQLEVDDLAATVAKLKQAGARFRNEIVAGMGGQQILLDDPAGNPIELFQPGRR